MRFLAGCLLCCLSILAAAQEAGKIDFLEGGVRLYDARQQERPARVGTAINEGDTVDTAADGEVHVAMADGGQLAVRPGTQLRVQSYRADGGKDDRSVLTLVRGAMRSITGWIGKYNQKNYEIRTPTATIGVRGTDHETRVIPEGSPEGEAGTYDKVNSGVTRMRTRFGQTDIKPNQAGFIPALGGARPRLLERVPAFFRATRNEHRIEGLREKIHERIERVREQRIREIGEKRGERLGNQRRDLANRQAERREARRHEFAQHRQSEGARGEVPAQRQELRQRRLEGQGFRHEAQGAAADRPRQRLMEGRQREAPPRKRLPAGDGDEAGHRPHPGGGHGHR